MSDRRKSRNAITKRRLPMMDELEKELILKNKFKSVWIMLAVAETILVIGFLLDWCYQ